MQHGPLFYTGRNFTLFLVSCVIILPCFTFQSPFSNKIIPLIQFLEDPFRGAQCLVLN